MQTIPYLASQVFKAAESPSVWQPLESALFCLNSAAPRCTDSELSIHQPPEDFQHCQHVPSTVALLQDILGEPMIRHVRQCSISLPKRSIQLLYATYYQTLGNLCSRIDLRQILNIIRQLSPNIYHSFGSRRINFELPWGILHKPVSDVDRQGC